MVQDTTYIIYTTYFINYTVEECKACIAPDVISNFAIKWLGVEHGRMSISSLLMELQQLLASIK